MAKTDKPAKSAAKNTKVSKEQAQPKTRAPVQRRVDPNETANTAKVLKAVEKAGPAGVLQSSLQEALGLHYPGWFYLEKLRDEGKVTLTRHNMRVYGTAKGVRFAAPAAPEKAPRATKAAKDNGKAATPAKATKAASTKVNGKAPVKAAKATKAAKAPKVAKAPKAAKASPSNGAAEQAANDLL
jgi:hypothetical protein